MIASKLHSCIDIFSCCYAFVEDRNSFIDHRDQDPVYYESRSFLDLNRSLSKFTWQVSYDLVGLFWSQQSVDNLNQLHCRNRIEEMHADNFVRFACWHSDIGNWQWRSVWCDYALRLSQLIKFSEQSFLSFHVLSWCFNDQISVFHDADISWTAYQSHVLFLLILCDLFLCNHLGEILLNLCNSLVYRRLMSSSHYYFIAMLSKYLYDSSTHCACS